MSPTVHKLVWNEGWAALSCGSREDDYSQSRQQTLKVMPETLVSELKILLVTATPGQTAGLNRVMGGALSCHTEGKDRETSSTFSFKSFVNVVNWANHRRLGVQVLDETGHRVLSAKRDSDSQMESR